MLEYLKGQKAQLSLGNKDTKRERTHMDWAGISRGGKFLGRPALN